MSLEAYTPFVGFLKQMSMADVGEAEQRLFVALFPQFLDRTGFSWDDHAEFRQQLAGGNDWIKFGERRVPRRYGGVSLPRGRYSTLCDSAEGNDRGTLTNELGAYRDPTHTGRVDIMDFGLSETTLQLPGRELTFERAPVLGLILFDWDQFRTLVEAVPHEQVEVVTGRTVALVRYPYRVRETHLSRVVDLRLPATRAWFADAFSKPNRDWTWPSADDGFAADDRLIGGPRTHHSAFERQDGQAPVPRSFAAMLPTLLNGDLGGGGHTGDTLMAIGETLRNQGVEGLIYPSARSDAFALIEQSRLQRFGGWCLVDLRPAEDAPLKQHVVIDRSPWSWVALPEGVQVMEAPPGPQAGTFGIAGMEEWSRAAYLHKVACLKTCNARLGPRQAIMSPPETFTIGVFLYSWLRRAVSQAPREEVQEAYEVGCGVLLRNERTAAADCLRWVRQRFGRTGDIMAALEGLSQVQERVVGTLPPDSEAVKILAATTDISFLLVLLTHRARLGKPGLGQIMVAPGLEHLTLPNHALLEADAFVTLLTDERTDPGEAAREAALLLETLAEVYEPRGDEATPFFERYSISLVGTRAST